MANTATIIITTDSTEGNLRDRLVNSNPSLLLSNFENYLSAIQSGSDAASINIKLNDGNAVAASEVLTCTSVAVGDTAQVNGHTFTAKDYREKTQVTAVADIAGSLADTYFTFSALNSAGAEVPYYVWYNVDATGTDPAVVGATAVEVAVTSGDTANTVAASSRAALSVLSTYFTTSGATNKIIFQNVYAGPCTDTADGAAATGFTFLTVIDGDDLGADEFQIGSNSITATNLAEAINTVNTYVSASSATNETTVTANVKGILGNTITISGSGGISSGSARLSGGTDDSSNITNNYQR